MHRNFPGDPRPGSRCQLHNLCDLSVYRGEASEGNWGSFLACSQLSDSADAELGAVWAQVVPLQFKGQKGN